MFNFSLSLPPFLPSPVLHHLYMAKAITREQQRPVMSPMNYIRRLVEFVSHHRQDHEICRYKSRQAWKFMCNYIKLSLSRKFENSNQYPQLPAARRNAQIRARRLWHTKWPLKVSRVSKFKLSCTGSGSFLLRDCSAQPSLWADESRVLFTHHQTSNLFTTKQLIDILPWLYTISSILLPFLSVCKIAKLPYSDVLRCTHCLWRSPDKANGLGRPTCARTAKSQSRCIWPSLTIESVHGILGGNEKFFWRVFRVYKGV